MIYLFDNEERLLKVVRRNAIKSALQKYALTTDNYVSDRLTVEMKTLNDDELEKVEYMAIQSMEDTHRFHYFYIAQKSTKGEISTLTGVQSGIEELRKPRYLISALKIHQLNRLLTTSYRVRIGRPVLWPIPQTTARIFIILQFLTPSKKSVRFGALKCSSL